MEPEVFFCFTFAVNVVLHAMNPAKYAFDACRLAKKKQMLSWPSRTRWILKPSKALQDVNAMIIVRPCLSIRVNAHVCSYNPIGKQGPTRIWTAIAGFRIQSANRYTIGPLAIALQMNDAGPWSKHGHQILHSLSLATQHHENTSQTANCANMPTPPITHQIKMLVFSLYTCPMWPWVSPGPRRDANGSTNHCLWSQCSCWWTIQIESTHVQDPRLCLGCISPHLIFSS